VRLAGRRRGAGDAGAGVGGFGARRDVHAIDSEGYVRGSRGAGDPGPRAARPAPSSTVGQTGAQGWGSTTGC
jgi:hypothetical protein